MLRLSTFIELSFTYPNTAFREELSSPFRALGTQEFHLISCHVWQDGDAHTGISGILA